MFLGVSTFGDIKDIDSDYCYEMRNFVPYPYRSLSVRSGFIKHNDTSLGAAIKSIFGYKQRFSTTRIIVVSHSTKLETV